MQIGNISLWMEPKAEIRIIWFGSGFYIKIFRLALFVLLIPRFILDWQNKKQLNLKKRRKV